MNRSIWRTSLMLILVGVISGLFLSALHFRWSAWDFRNNLWGPSYLLLHGTSPYRLGALFEQSNAVWFPMVIGAFSFLGLLDPFVAMNLWLTLNISLMVILVFWSFLGTPPLLELGVLLVIVLLFPPFVSHLLLGQVTVVL